MREPLVIKRSIGISNECKQENNEKRDCNIDERSREKLKAVNKED